MSIMGKMMRESNWLLYVPEPPKKPSNIYYCTCNTNDKNHTKYRITKIDCDGICLDCGYYAHQGQFENHIGRMTYQKKRSKAEREEEKLTNKARKIQKQIAYIHLPSKKLYFTATSASKAYSMNRTSIEFGVKNHGKYKGFYKYNGKIPLNIIKKHLQKGKEWCMFTEVM